MDVSSHVMIRSSRGIWTELIAMLIATDLVSRLRTVILPRNPDVAEKNDEHYTSVYLV